VTPSDRYRLTMGRHGHGALVVLACTECPAQWTLTMTRAEYSDYDQREQHLEQWETATVALHDQRHAGQEAA
jgi:hypothetical protein